MTDCVTLNKLQFHAMHGVLPQEKAVGHNFVVTAKLICDFKEAMKTDKVEKTVDYGEVYNIIKKQMAKRAKLMENVAYRIIQDVFKHFNSVSSVYISIFKENPPISAQCEGCGVEIEINREEFDNL
mgnify:CR=1 FL=1